MNPKKLPSQLSPIREVVVVPVFLATFPTSKAHLIFKKVQSRVQARSEHPSFLVDMEVEGQEPRRVTIVRSAVAYGDATRWFAQGHNSLGVNDPHKYAYGVSPNEAYEKFATNFWPN